jgi:hypothetical protein
VPRAAGVIGGELASTGIAFLKMSAERGGAACADVTEYAPLLPGQGVSPGGEELLFVLTKDIGDFQPMLPHCW